mmetsp:Transcript_1185/g.3038  ORF Transcript_1185/g.3038 Transcript_1185/m.3038 type:complete len:235 (+) Transcript_1185:2516-3220(+)
MHASLTIVLLVEAFQSVRQFEAIPLWVQLQCLQVASGKLADWTQWVGARFYQVKKSPSGVRHVLLVLGIHGVNFFVHHTVSESRFHKKLSKYVECLLEAFIANLCIVHGLVTGGVSVALTTKKGQPVREGVFFRIFLGTKKDHVFAEMCQALKFVWVIQRANLNSHCIAGLLGIRILDKQNLQSGLHLHMVVGAPVCLCLPDIFTCIDELAGNRCCEIDSHGVLCFSPKKLSTG